LKTDIIVRKAKTSDIPQLVKLYSNTKEITDFAGQKHDKAYFSKCFRSKITGVFVAVQGKEVLGVTTAEFDPIFKYTYASKIVVSKKHRGKGIATMLMKAVEQESKRLKIKRIFGFVYVWNKNMQKIMEHLGFSSQGKTIIYSKKV